MSRNTLTIRTLPSDKLWTTRLDQLLNLAQRDDGAADVLVDRLLDLELERRMELLHDRVGDYGITSSELVGMPTGGSSRPAEIQYRAGSGMSEWHHKAKHLVAQLPQRRQIAVLFQAAKCSPRKTSRAALWQASYAQVVDDLPTYLLDLGFAPGIAETRPYRNGQALKDAARAGKAWLKEQIVGVEDE
ncbi:hypothetical protein [Halomonas alimentaria]|uniref:Uncharacterized protein n=1 Tax=Halomonas alimentaria TaxID=147248 RepID=A0A7X4W5Y5_9GAMM|nr:hypothetical protein [Halomonas alimentaria]NAW34993.1 hypothetical protein [Halomonas alimentaria]